MPNIIFDPPPGLNTDESLLGAAGQWEDGDNVRFVNGKPQAIGGWAVRASGAGVTGVPRKMLQWVSSDGTARIAIGTSTKLYVEVGGAMFDITPTGVTSVNQWSLAVWGDTLLASPAGGKLYQWSLNTSVIAAEITQAPDNITCMLVTPERQCIAVGCNEEISTTFNGRCIRGCDFEDLTDWTTTTTNNAFEHILDASGQLVTARYMGGGLALWTDSQLHVGQFLGDPAQTYRFDKVAGNCGALGLDVVTVVGSTAYYIGDEYQLLAWTPGSSPVPMACPLIRTFQNAITAVGAKSATSIRSYSSYNARFNEVWFHYGVSANANATRYIAVNLDTGKWFRGTHSENGGGRTATVQGPLHLLCGMATGRLYTLESGKQGTSNQPLGWSLSSGHFYTDNAKSRAMLRSVMPDFATTDGTITLTITPYEYPRASGGTPVALSVGASLTKNDFRLSGRLFKIAFSGNDTTGTTDTFMALGTPVFDYVKTGQR